MPTIKNHAAYLSTTLTCLASAVLFACHNDVHSFTTTSATDDDHFFGTTSSSPTEPTTSAGDPTDGAGEPTTGGINPSDFCKLHPADDFPGFVYVCSGTVRGGINFDYYGDAGLPLDNYIPCIDMSAPPFELEKPTGYVYSCFIESGNYPFGPDVPQPNGHQIDACCQQDSPIEAPIEYCRIDGAEEFCLGASDGLNEFRAQLPHIPALTELHLQLENLNKFLATSGTQTSCAKGIASDLLAAGDFSELFAKAGWQVENMQALDPELGWPWFREIRMDVYEFQIDDAQNNGLACDQLEEDALLGGRVEDGQLLIRGEMGTGTTRARGEFSYRRSDCRLASCEVALETLDLRVKDFTVGSLVFSDVSVSLATPAVGLIEADAIALPENGMHLTATFRLTSDGRPLFEGAPVSVGLRNHGVAHFRLLAGTSLAVQKLDVARWPFQIELVSLVSR